MKLPLVTLLILNYNGMRYIKNCLDSVLATAYPNFRVAVIDNASTDGSAEFIEESYPEIMLIKLKKNYGFAKAYNLALRSISSEYVALLNNDIEVEPSWLKKLIFYMEKDEKVAAANPKMLFIQDRRRINAAGGCCDIYGVGWNRGNGEIDRGQYDKVQEVFYANGAAMLIRERAWKEVGPFDERYFLYGEDLDWCWRAQLKGYKILYVPEAKIYHYWRASSGTIISLLEKHWTASLIKNYSLKTLVMLMPRFIVLKILKALWLIKNGETLNEKTAVIESFLWNMKNLRGTLEKRKKIQLERKITDEQLMEKMYKGSFELLLWRGLIRHPILIKKHSKNEKRETLWRSKKATKF